CFAHAIVLGLVDRRWATIGAFADGDTGLANAVSHCIAHRADRVKRAARSALTLRPRVPAGRPVRLESAVGYCYGTALVRPACRVGMPGQPIWPLHLRRSMSRRVGAC